MIIENNSPQKILGLKNVFLPHKRLLKRAGIYVDQSQRTSRFWKCSLDPRNFRVRLLREDRLHVIAVVIKEKVKHINFMLWLRCRQLYTE